MSSSKLIEKLEKRQQKEGLTSFQVGDTIRVHTRIIEGDKERIQIFTGTVVAKKGSGASETFTLHRVAYGEGMERVFLLHSPRIAKIEVSKAGKARRAKLYYLRGTSGKAAKVQGRTVTGNAKNAADAPEADVAAVESIADESASSESN